MEAIMKTIIRKQLLSQSYSIPGYELRMESLATTGGLARANHFRQCWTSDLRAKKSISKRFVEYVFWANIHPFHTMRISNRRVGRPKINSSLSRCKLNRQPSRSRRFVLSKIKPYHILVGHVISSYGVYSSICEDLTVLQLLIDSLAAAKRCIRWFPSAL
jgi:hypothetical protein